MTGPTSPCGSCGQQVSARAAFCPLCEEPTGFDALTPLGSGTRLLKLGALGLSLLLGAAYLAGRWRGSAELAELREVLRSRGAPTPAEVEEARQAELDAQAQLRARLAGLEAQLVERAPALAEAKELEAELEAQPDPAKLSEVRTAREAAFRAQFPGRR